MFKRALFRFMILLSVFTATSMALAQEADFAETDDLGDLGESDNDTVTMNASFTAVDTASVMIEVDDNVTLKDDVNDTDAIGELASSESAGSSNDTTPIELLPVEESIASIPEAPMLAASSITASMTVVPAVEDVYVDLTEEMIYNDDNLVCEYLMGDRYEEDDYPGVVMVQFDISDIEIIDDDVGVLVLKAESIEKKGGAEMAGIFIVPVTSEWSEDSSATAMALNMLPFVFTITDGDDFDFSQFGMDFGDDEIFAFDVSEHLKAAEGGRISFLLMAFGDVDYRVSFKSRETGEGPILLIAPYPSVPAT